MKIPLNWLKNYVSVPKDIKNLTDNLTMVGHMLDGYAATKEGVVIDLELRGNRADCYSIYGIAREVAAIYKTTTKYPELKKNLKKTKSLKGVKLSVDSSHVNRVVMGTLKNVKITDSPKWLKEALTKYGIDSINNLVDLTNYVAIELGQPMHAFDQDKIGKQLTIRQAKKNEKMTTFQDKVLTLISDDLVWANDKKVLSVAGAIGGKDHSISKTTKNILVEAANYDRANIRRSVHRHNLFTEAGIRHEKDLDPNMVDEVIARFLYLVEKNKWGKVSNIISDYYPDPINPWSLNLNFKNLNSLGGIEIEVKEIKKILKSLNFEILKETKQVLSISVPTYRTDVKLEADLIEEIIRIYGYDKIPVHTLSQPVPVNVTPDYILQELKIKSQLSALGFNEIISSSFVKEELKRLNVPNEPSLETVDLQNPPSPDFKEMRMTLLPNLVEVSQKATNERVSKVMYFEVGKVYGKNKNYKESRKLGVLYYDKELGSYAKFKGYLEAFFNLNSLKASLEGSKEIYWLSDVYVIKLKNNNVGFGGKYKDMFFAEIDLDSILKDSKDIGVELWPKYPPQIEDVTFKLPQKTKVGEVLEAILSTKFISDAKLTIVYEDAYTFRVWYQSKDKTLTAKEVDGLRKKLINTVQSKFGGVIK